MSQLPPPLCTATLAFVIASSVATAQADPRPPSNIPEPEQKLAATTEELPLPYQPWTAAGFAPRAATPPADLPPPLARNREQPRRPFEATAALAAFLPSCGSGSIDDRGCLTVGAGSGVDLAVMYRVGPFFAFGGEAALSGFAHGDQSARSRGGGAARFFGVAGRVYFVDEGAWDPYVALTLGVGKLELSEPNDRRESTTGLGARVAGGIDYALGSHFRVGPTASFTHWVAWSEASCSGAICRDERAVYGRLLGFATLGLRLTASFGDVL